MELENKYLVLKISDIHLMLTGKQKIQLSQICLDIETWRKAQGKPINKYVVINQDEAYFPDVLRLMEGTEDARAEAQAGEPTPATPLLLFAGDDLRTLSQAGLVQDVPTKETTQECHLCADADL